MTGWEWMLERNKRIVTKVLNGQTLQSVGEEFDITRTRVGMIVRQLSNFFCSDEPHIRELRKDNYLLIPLIERLRTHEVYPHNFLEPTPDFKQKAAFKRSRSDDRNNPNYHIRGPLHD